MSAALVTVAVAKAHLRLDALEGDADLYLKIKQATAIVVQYIDRPTDETWTATVAEWDELTVPAIVQAAVLLQLGELWRFRGDDAQVEQPKPEHGYLAPGVANLLHRYRDPVLA